MKWIDWNETQFGTNRNSKFQNFKIPNYGTEWDDNKPKNGYPKENNDSNTENG